MNCTHAVDDPCTAWCYVTHGELYNVTDDLLLWNNDMAEALPRQPWYLRGWAQGLHPRVETRGLIRSDGEHVSYGLRAWNRAPKRHR